MVPEQWSVSFDAAANIEKYKIPRGQAATFAKVVSVLFNGPKPKGYKPVEDLLEVYEYTQKGYRIVYEVLRDERRIRVMLFELV